jgi:hypothetical protein
LAVAALKAALVGTVHEDGAGTRQLLMRRRPPDIRFQNREWDRPWPSSIRRAGRLEQAAKPRRVGQHEPLELGVIPWNGHEHRRGPPVLGYDHRAFPAARDVLAEAGLHISQRSDSHMTNSFPPTESRFPFFSPIAST